MSTSNLHLTCTSRNKSNHCKYTKLNNYDCVLHVIISTLVNQPAMQFTNAELQVDTSVPLIPGADLNVDRQLS